jgi:hypothetical protein
VAVAAARPGAGAGRDPWVTTRATPWDLENVMTRALKGPNIVFNPAVPRFTFH